MSRNPINTRYSIEYLHPGAATSSNSSSSKSKLLIPLLLSAILIGLGAFLWKQGFLSQFSQSNSEVVNSISPNAEEEQPTALAANGETAKGKLATASSSVVNYSDRTGEQIFLDKCSYCHGKKGQGNLKDIYPKLQGQRAAYLLLQLKRMRDGKRLNVNPSMFAIIKKMDNQTFKKIANHISKIPSPTGDKKLVSQLAALSTQLDLEKKKNTELSDQIKKNLEVSNSLSKLYDQSLENTKGIDKDFMKIIKTEEKRTSLKNKSASTPVVEKEPVVTKAEATTIVAKVLDADNSINRAVEVVSTSSQMDKIVSTLKNRPVSVTQTESTKRIYVDIDSKVVEESVSIQDKINQLSQTQVVPETRFTNALKKENKVRENSVRSIVVRKGDTLWSISKRAYGTGFSYPKILKANPSIRKGKVVILKIGQVVRVPR